MHLPCKCITGNSEFIINMSTENDIMGLVRCFSMILMCDLRMLKVHEGMSLKKSTCSERYLQHDSYRL